VISISENRFAFVLVAVIRWHRLDGLLADWSHCSSKTRKCTLFRQPSTQMRGCPL